MMNFDFLEGAILSDEEMIVVHGGISVAMTGGDHCGSGCDCRPVISGNSSTEGEN